MGRPSLESDTLTTATPDRRAPQVAPLPAPGAPAAGTRAPIFRRAAEGFETEFNAYLQERLRLCVGVLTLVGIALLGMHWLLAPQVSEWYPGFWRHPSTHVHLGGAVGVGVMYLVLRRGRWNGRALVAADLVLQLMMIGTCLLMYLLSYEQGNRSLVPFLGLLIVTRAVVVPSRAMRTLLGALTAPVGILAIQLAHGRLQYWHGHSVPQEGFVEVVSWDFIYLFLSALIAAVASRVNFRLRVSAYEARRLDQYVLEGLIGKGAMGEVHRARHALMRRPTAIKLVRTEVLTERLLKRFEQEVRHTSRLTHPNTIRVFDYGQTADGVFYYAMELLEGADLDRVVEAAGPLPPGRVIHVLTQALSALAEAHAMGLVHRDVKPGNLILCRQGLAHDVVKVTDFGLVRDTEAVEPSLASADEICGSPQTIAPEVVKGQKATQAADLYALGAVGCWLLTGKPIFDATNVMEFVVAHMQQPPIRPSARKPDVPADLEAVLMSCLAKDPFDRPGSADSLRTALLACADAGRWTETDAAAWWKEHGPALQPESASASATGTR
jgi:eukaryotic-like serine/threonine-protein kinase